MMPTRRIVFESLLLQWAIHRHVRAFPEVDQMQTSETHPAACSNVRRCRRTDRAHDCRENGGWRIAARTELHKCRSASGESDSVAGVSEERESPGRASPSFAQEQKTLFHRHHRPSRESR